MRQDNAFSGLEAAIVLIAFVVVAAVFSYVMLGAGFFATQKSQEVTYSGVKQSTSNLVLDGNLYGTVTDAGQTRTGTVTFYLTVPEGGQPQKLSEVDYTVTVQGIRYTPVEEKGDITSANKYVVTDQTDGTAVSTAIITPGTKSKMLLLFGDNGASDAPSPGNTFTIEIRPKVGAATLISKTLVTGYKGGVII